MIEVKNDAIAFSCPEVHLEARCTVIFQRTLRLPDDAEGYPVPPGLGRFPLSSLKENGQRLPDSWCGEGALFPVFQSEAFWIIFVGWYPFAVKVSMGGVNAITGRKLNDERLWRPRDYTVVPRSPWMEWFSVGGGKGRQFVAMPLGKGRDGRVSGKAQIRITAYPMRAERYAEYRRSRSALMSSVAAVAEGSGGAAGWFGHPGSDGDDYGPGAWQTEAGVNCSVYPVNSRDYLNITGSLPPGKAPTAAQYREAGIPWQKKYGTDKAVLASCRYLAS